MRRARALLIRCARALIYFRRLGRNRFRSHDVLTGTGPDGKLKSSNVWNSGCAPGVNLSDNSIPGQGGDHAVGAGGGHGAIYCFALTP